MQSESGLQESLAKLECYVKRWKLKINFIKSKVLILIWELISKAAVYYVKLVFW
jgi:hypothetical protein